MKILGPLVSDLLYLILRLPVLMFFFFLVWFDGICSLHYNIGGGKCTGDLACTDGQTLVAYLVMVFGFMDSR